MSGAAANRPLVADLYVAYLGGGLGQHRAYLAKPGGGLYLIMRGHRSDSNLAALFAYI